MFYTDKKKQFPLTTFISTLAWLESESKDI